jgi:hypothetical protein
MTHFDTKALSPATLNNKNKEDLQRQHFALGQDSINYDSMAKSTHGWKPANTKAEDNRAKGVALRATHFKLGDDGPTVASTFKDSFNT